MIGLKKGPWSAEEDQILVEYIRHHGHGSWRALPIKAGLLRCGKSCRLRWTNYLRPGIKRGTFSSEEEQTIIRLHALLGNKWSTIAGHLPGRTDNEIKNYWNTRLKKRLLQRGIDPVTHRPILDVNFLRGSFNLDPREITGGWDNGRLEEELARGWISGDQYQRLAAAAAAYSILMSENQYPDLCNMRPYWISQTSEYMNCCASVAPTISADYNGVLPVINLEQFMLQESTNNIPIIHREDTAFSNENHLIAGAASELYGQKENYTLKEDDNFFPSTILQEAVLFNSKVEMPRSSTPADATQYCRLEDLLPSTVMKDEPKSLITYSSSHDMTNILEYPDLLSDINSMDSNCSYGQLLAPELLCNQGLQ